MGSLAPPCQQSRGLAELTTANLAQPFHVAADGRLAAKQYLARFVGRRQMVLLL